MKKWKMLMYKNGLLDMEYEGDYLDILYRVWVCDHPKADCFANDIFSYIFTRQTV
jgi:hypothetical protein